MTTGNKNCLIGAKLCDRIDAVIETRIRILKSSREQNLHEHTPHTHMHTLTNTQFNITELCSV